MKIKKIVLGAPEVQIKTGFKVVDTGLKLVTCTQEEYDAMEVHDDNTLYFIAEVEE